MKKHRKYISKLVCLCCIFAIMFTLFPTVVVFADGNSDILTERKLTDKEIAQLTKMTAAEVQEKISTFADCQAYLNKIFPSLWHDASISNMDDDPISQYTSGKIFADGKNRPDFAGRCDMTTIATYLLKDDMDICGIYAVGNECTQGINCINTGNGYIMADIVNKMDANAGCDRGTSLPEGKYKTLSAFVDAVFSDGWRTQCFDSLGVDREGLGFLTYQNNGLKSFLKYGGAPVEYTGTSPFDDSLLTERKLTDDDVAALWGKPAAVVRKKISTLPDVLAFLDSRVKRTTADNLDVWGADGKNYSGVYFLTFMSDSEEFGWSDITTIATYLLNDDMDICGMYAMGGSDILPINCINTGSGLKFVNIMSRLKCAAKSGYLPEAECSSMEEYVETAKKSTAAAKGFESFMVDTQGMGFLTYTVKNNKMLLPPPEIIYTNESKRMTDEEYYESTYGRIKPENIYKYQLSGLLGGVTLTPEEAYALVGAEPEVVQEKVKTAADVLMYMLAANIQDSHGDKSMMIGSNEWHYNMSAKEVMETATGNCGSSANLARYLLDGDYDEVGIVTQAYYPGNGGGHVYTYIKDKGKYFVIDYSWYIFSNYDVYNDFPAFRVGNLDSMEDFVPYVEGLYGGVCLIIYSSSILNDPPCIFDDNASGGAQYVVPEGLEYTVLKEDKGGYKLTTRKLNTEKHPMFDWTVFWRE